MNIAQAAAQIEGAVRAYLARDARGMLLIPHEMQRPIIVMGPPGIGKTAIASQVAERLRINFVSYSMTHHTRQSAIGLPYIAEASYGGRDVRVSRYTMSEIIAAAYDAIERTGVGEGVLFLDEVNCVSETLAPAMLQFLQYKTFGQHRLPEGWVVVCAANPPEYNRSARDFDPAMMDRMKRIDVEPELEVWMAYATSHGVHPAITSYLANKPKSFYRVRAAVSGARMVTARGWEDLSRMLVAYRAEGIEAGPELVRQYLQDAEIADDFALYLELFEKYQGDYRVDEILAGTAPAEIVRRARAAALDERVALVRIISGRLVDELHDVSATEDALRALRTELAGARPGLEAGPDEACAALDDIAARTAAELDEAREKGGGSIGRQVRLVERASTLGRLADALARWSAGVEEAGSGFEVVREAFNAETRSLSRRVGQAAGHVEAALDFLGKAFGEDQEMLVLVGNLAQDQQVMRFVSAHGPARFVEASRSLMFHERGIELLREVRALEELEG